MANGAQGAAASTLGGKANALFSDRNFLSLLAGMGSKFGRGGAGEAIGVPTQQMIQSLATQEAVAKGEKQRSELNQALLSILGGGTTPAEMPGLTSAMINDKGIKLDITPEGTGESAFGGISGGGNPAATGFSPTGTTPSVGSPLVPTPTQAPPVVDLEQPGVVEPNTAGMGRLTDLFPF